MTGQQAPSIEQKIRVKLNVDKLIKSTEYNEEKKDENQSLYV